jgi:hypothetical protein
VLGIAGVLIAIGLFAAPRLPFQRATISDALFTPRPEETVYGAPKPFAYEGYVEAVLVSGEGLRIRTPQAEGGYVDVYTTDGLSASVSEGAVRVRGVLLGISCSYGKCVPYGDLADITSLPPELE